MIDEDEINLQNKLDWKQRQEEREVKNRILAMSNNERKQKLWQKYFPAPMQLSSNEVY